MEEFSVDDTPQLLQAASDYAFYIGGRNDASTKEFLDRFPLPVLFNALQTKRDIPVAENILVACLERIFNTRYGALLIPQYMPFVQLGLKADSQIVRKLACKTVTCLLKNFSEDGISPVQLIADNDVYPLLLDCLIQGNEQVANSSMETITKLVSFPQGMEIVFPTDSTEATHLGALATKCSSLKRVRLLALIVKLFSVSNYVASVIYKMDLLRLFEGEINNSSDTLVTLSVLELLYELSEIQHGREFLSESSLLVLLSSIISNNSMGSMLRSRAMIISGRLLHGNHTSVEDSGTKAVISAITKILDSSETHETDECESALEALGHIGSSIQGAQLLLSSSPAAAKHVIDAAFDRQGHGKQLAALHALANIAGETRTDGNVILDNNAEESLRRFIYEKASKSSKLRPYSLILSIIHQDSEFRLAGYRMITGLVARPWFLMEICSKQEIINRVTDPSTETTKIGMEGRYSCCKAIQKNLMSKVTSDSHLSAIADKVNEAIKLGPYLTRKCEAQPAVMTADRF